MTDKPKTCLTDGSGMSSIKKPMINDLLPCPCCKSKNLTSNLWDLDGGEVDAVECNDCYTGAPLSSWQDRANEWIDYQNIKPADGEEILAYILINPETHGGFNFIKPILKKYRGMYLSGPQTVIVQQKFIDDGARSQIAFWQTIDALPK